MVKQFALSRYVIWLFAGTAFAIIGTTAVIHWTIGLLALLLALSLGWAGYRVYFRQAFVETHVLKSGEPAMAIILKVWETGVTVDHNPRIGMLLEIRHNAMVPYEVEIKHNVRKENLKYFQAGRTLQVKIDGRNNKKVAIETA